MRLLLNKYSLVIQVLVFVLACWAFIFHPDEELDLYRYYENANNLSVNTSAWDYIRFQFLTETDFLYGLSFLFVKKIGLPVNAVNFFFVGLYYWLIYKVLLLYSVKKSAINHSSWFFVCIAIFAFFVAQPVLVFSISRQLSAICMFYIGILYYLRGKYKLCGLFIVLSMLFHVGMFMFIAFLLIAYLLYKSRIYQFFARKTFIVLLVGGLLISMVSLSNVLGVIDNFAFIFSERYQNTYMEMEQSTMDLSIDMMLQMLLLLLGLSFLKSSNLLFSIGMVLYFGLCFFSANVFFLLQRVFLFLPVFQGMLACEYFNSCRKSEGKMIYFGVMIVATLFSVLTIYLYRRCFF